MHLSVVPVYLHFIFSAMIYIFMSIPDESSEDQVTPLARALILRSPCRDWSSDVARNGVFWHFLKKSVCVCFFFFITRYYVQKWFPKTILTFENERQRWGWGSPRSRCLLQRQDLSRFLKGKGSREQCWMLKQTKHLSEDYRLKPRKERFTTVNIM